jgi:outer membrane protein insertion porin family
MNFGLRAVPVAALVFAGGGMAAAPRAGWAQEAAPQQPAPQQPAPGVPATPPDADQYPGQGLPIGAVNIRGIKNTNPEIVRLALASAGIKEGQPFRADSVAAARKTIVDKGLYSDVYIRSEVTGDRKTVVTAEVFENPVITQVVIKGNRSIPSEKILPFLASKPGTVVDVTALREDAKRIQRIYRDAGYEAYLSELEEVFDTKTGILTFPVIETVVDSIEVQGLKKTKPYVVLREMRTKVGEPLNRNTLQRDLTRILATGLFSDVKSPRPEPLDEGRVKLIIPVEEQRTGQVQVGVGYSVRQRLTGTLQVSESNFRGRGQGVTASWTLSGAVAHNQYELGFTEPWLDKHNTSLGVNVYDRLNFRFNRTLSSTVTNGESNNPYYEDTRGGTISLSRPVSEFSRVSTSFRIESVQANNLQPDYTQLTNDEINGIRGSLVQSGHVNSMALRYLTNTRDNEQDPAAGFFFSPTVEFGVGNFETQKPFVNPAFISPTVTPTVSRVQVVDRSQRGPFTKGNVDFRRYLRMDKTPRQSLRDPKKVLAGRLLLGTATGNIGFSEQYFMGGADNLRGYADDRFWGNSVFLASLEYRIPVDRSGAFTWVLFTDCGDAWGASSVNQGSVPGYEQHGSFAPHFGFGTGVRLKTPVGPVRLDLGFGETTRTHFSIGQAF